MKPKPRHARQPRRHLQLGRRVERTRGTFALSYIENALTSNAVLAPLASREAGDLHAMVRMARRETLRAPGQTGTLSGLGVELAATRNAVITDDAAAGP